VDLRTNEELTRTRSVQELAGMLVSKRLLLLLLLLSLPM